jgi:heme/copper-type cytochrome/quinol oxidase subunit 2
MLDKDTMENRRKKNLIYYSLLLLLIDISLNFPIILLAYQEEVREYNIIIAITFALITTIKFVLAIRGYIKTRKNYDTKTYIFKNITFTSALVSVISLQNVLISSASDNPKDDAKIFVSTSFLIFGVILLVSILSIIKSIKIRKALK